MAELEKKSGPKVDLFTKFKAEGLGGSDNIKSIKELKKLGSFNVQKRWNWAEAEKRQKYAQKNQMFSMVLFMTWCTYIIVLFIILSQVVRFGPIDSWQQFFEFKWVFVEQLSIEKFGLILSGFLAELLLLPKIILRGLFETKD